MMMMTMTKRQSTVRNFSFVSFCVTLAALLLPVSLSASVNKNTQQQQREEEHGGGGGYGIDVSAPVQHYASQNYDWLPHNIDPHNPVPPLLRGQPIQTLGNRHQFYLDYLDGCRNHYSSSSPEYASYCDRFELDRMLMNQRQPQSMKNYTDIGFKKIRAPDNVVKLIEAFWKNNHYKGKEENWHVGNSYVNHWESPTFLISVDDKGLRGSGPELKEQIWAAASATLEEWTSQELQPVSMYGIRVYGEGAVMMPHVDRLPLVASAMICVAQDVDEPWPTEVYDHSGRAHNVTFEPGDMLLFESHSVIHGHPFPLQGRFQAMIFIHFEPTGQSLLHDASGWHVDDADSVENSSNDNNNKKSKTSINQEYKSSVNQGIGGQSSATTASGSLPPYIQRATPEEKNWRKLHPEGWKPPVTVLPPEAHIAARAGNLNVLEKQLAGADDPNKILTQRDEHGWQILHQGVASGMKDVVELLVNRGADINARTHGGYGETPLRIAEEHLGAAHQIVQYLKSLGALSIGPEL